MTPRVIRSSADAVDASDEQSLRAKRGNLVMAPRVSFSNGVATSLRSSRWQTGYAWGEEACWQLSASLGGGCCQFFGDRRLVGVAGFHQIFTETGR